MQCDATIGHNKKLWLAYEWMCHAASLDIFSSGKYIQLYSFERYEIDKIVCANVWIENLNFQQSYLKVA